jgi:hypothetical protein
MENALLYTFSTIAQALGGAFALLAAFVLYRFQSLGPMMVHDSAEIRGCLSRGGGDLTLFDSMRLRGNWRGLVLVIDSIMETDEPGISSAEGELIFRMKMSLELQILLEQLFRFGAFMTAATMAYSVAAIPFAHLIYAVSWLSWLMLVCGVAGFLACLHAYWNIIKAALYSPPSI